LALDFKSGPKFSGNFNVNDAVLTLSTDNSGKGNSGKNIVFPLNFGMDVNLNKNVYIVMGDVSTLNLSTILMNLEVGCEGLHVGGTLATPSLNGKVQLKRGTVNIFNREFTLLSKDMVKKYFPYDSENTIDNYASFAGEEGSAGVLPKINLTAQIEVENTEKDISGKNVKKKVFILANLKGKMGAKSEGEGLKIFLAGYNEDKSKSPAEMTPMPYSEQDLKVMLLPDFIKSFAGIGTKDEAQVDTNVVIADYLSSRVQSMLFRSLEREAEQKLGLESLTLEYNLGPKVKEALGLKDTRNFQDDKPAWSVGFVKGLADRLYLDVRYSQPMEGRTVTTAQNSFNYQLTYKLTPICSILYYREPINVYDLTTGYQKVTLKFGYSFW